MEEGQGPPKRTPLPLSALDDELPAFPAPKETRERTKLTPYAPAPQPVAPTEEPAVVPVAASSAAARFGATKPTPYTREDIAYVKNALATAQRESAPVVVMAEPFVPQGFGDRAREHLVIKRSRRTAWGHVVLAFVLEIALLGGLLALVAWRAALAAGMTGGALWVLVAVGAGLGALAAYAVFRDRFRCVEAVASRYVVDAAFISILWVPFVALAYANARGARKLVGR